MYETQAPLPDRIDGPNRRRKPCSMQLRDSTSSVASPFPCWGLRELSAQFLQVTRDTRDGRNVPALAATREALALAYARAFSPVLGEMPHIVGLDRDGAVAAGRSARDAFEHVDRLEHVCQMALASGVRPPISHPAGVAVTAQYG